MSISSDMIVEQRKLRKGLSLWRIIAIIFVVAFICITIIGLAGGLDPLKSRRDHVAHITISGFIGYDRDFYQMIDEISENDAVKAVIVSIESPGGTTAGGEALHLALRDLSEKKPVIATISTIATSAAYMAAIATDHVIARQTSLTGSIGVVFQYAKIIELMDKIGVDVRSIKSGVLKAEPSPFSEETPQIRAEIDRLIADSYNWFIDLVAERRDMSPERIRSFQGGVFSGREALERQLIDGIGGQKEARQWLAEQHDISEDLPLHEHNREEPIPAWMQSHSHIQDVVIGWLKGQDPKAMKNIMRDFIAHDGLMSHYP
jgi:protease-4